MINVSCFVSMCYSITQVIHLVNLSHEGSDEPLHEGLYTGANYYKECPDDGAVPEALQSNVINLGNQHQCGATQESD